MTENDTDILENDILRRWPEVLRALLKDHTTTRNIFWAKDMYEKKHGESYSFHHQITVEQITGDKDTVTGQGLSNPLRSERIVFVA